MTNLFWYRFFYRAWLVDRWVQPLLQCVSGGLVESFTLLDDSHLCHGAGLGSLARVWLWLMAVGLRQTAASWPSLSHQLACMCPAGCQSGCASRNSTELCWPHTKIVACVRICACGGSCWRSLLRKLVNLEIHGHGSKDNPTLCQQAVHACGVHVAGAQLCILGILTGSLQWSMDQNPQNQRSLKLVHLCNSKAHQTTFENWSKALTDCSASDIKEPNLSSHYLECSCHMTNQGYQHRWACAIESCVSLHEARTVDTYWSLRCLTLLRVQQVCLVALVSSLAWRSKRRCREKVGMGLHQGSHMCYRTLIRHWTNHESNLVSDTNTQDSTLTQHGIETRLVAMGRVTSATAEVWAHHLMWVWPQLFLVYVRPHSWNNNLIV